MMNLPEKTTNHRRRQSGFTLIELLITVAIVAILATLASTAYLSYTARAQASEAMTVSEGVRQAYQIHMAENGGVPPVDTVELLGAGATGEGYAGQYVGSTTVSGGQVMVRYNTKADAPLTEEDLFFTPYETSQGIIVWQCGNAPVPTTSGVSPTPLDVAGTTAGSPITGVSVTTLPDRVLPQACRSTA